MQLAIYAHFSSTHRVVPFAWPYLDSLLQLGFKLIFVSNSDICEQDKIRLEGICVKVIVRENIGLDFGMWKSAIDTEELAGVTELLLTNSSIIGPLLPLAPIFEQARHWRYDFWGMTDNTELAKHLQSYFIVMNERVIRSQAFMDFWKSVLPFGSKDQIVMSYEVGLTTWLEEQGFSWRPFVFQKDVWQAYLCSRDFTRKIADRIRGRSLPMGNTTLLFPDILLTMGAPFLKSSLLKHGSRRVKTSDVLSLLRERWKYGDVLLREIELECSNRASIEGNEI